MIKRYIFVVQVTVLFQAEQHYKAFLFNHIVLIFRTCHGYPSFGIFIGCTLTQNNKVPSPSFEGGGDPGCFLVDVQVPDVVGRVNGKR